MEHISKKTPIIKDEVIKPLAQKLLEQIHRRRGLIRHLEKYAGINGKHFKQEPVENMPESRLLKVLIHKAKWQGEEDFMQDFIEMGLAIVKLAQKIQ